MSIQEQPLPYIRRTILEFVFPGDEGVAWWEGLGGLCQGFGLRFSPLPGEEIMVLTRRILNLNKGVDPRRGSEVDSVPFG